MLNADDYARFYRNAFDSVDIINELKGAPDLIESDKERLALNIQHIEWLLSLDGWTAEDLSPFEDAIA